MKIFAKTAREKTKRAQARLYKTTLKEIYVYIKEASLGGKSMINFGFLAHVTEETREKVLNELNNNGYRVVGPMVNERYIVEW